MFDNVSPVATTGVRRLPVSRVVRRGAPGLRRTRLLSALDEPTAVTVLRAPEGFGKTGLLRQWSEMRADAAWLTVRPDGTADAPWWASVGDLLAAGGQRIAGRAGSGSLRATGERLLAMAGSAALIVDDVDKIAPWAPDEVLGLLRSRPGLRVILAGRGSRWFPDDLLADIGARVIGADELLFTQDEVAELLSQAVPYLAARGSYWADEVYRSTGGWPEITAAVARRMAAAPPDAIELSAIVSRTGADYLRGRLIPELERTGVVDLALGTALAERFDASLAAAVTEVAEAQTALTRLVDRGLLIAQTVGGQTGYRWPDATRRMLVEELTCRAPDRVAALHAAWATRLLEHGRPRDAVRHAAAARDWPLLVTIVDTAWRGLLYDDDREVRAALLAAPVEALAGSARALALREILLFSPGSPSSGFPTQDAPPLPALPVSAAALARLATVDQLADLLDSGLLVIAAHRHRGRQAAALQHARRLLEIVTVAHDARPGEVARHRPSLQLAVGVELMLTGDLAAAITALELARRLGATGSGSPARFVTATAESLLGVLHALRGDVAAARRWRTPAGRVVGDVGCSRAMAHLAVGAAVTDLLIAIDELDASAAAAAVDRLALLDPASPWLDQWALACYAQAHYALHRGDVDAALDRIARARVTHGYDLGDDGIAGPLLAAAEANLLIAAGRGNQARRSLRSNPAHPLARVPAARLALLSGDPTGAIHLAVDQAWEGSVGTRDRVEMRLIRAIAAYRFGDLPLAVFALDRAARATRDAGLRSVWATVPRDELDELARRVPSALQILADPLLAATPEVYPRSIELIELSGREQEVLDRLAAGATIEQVAAALTISHNTVKTHVQNIYRKLRADSRQTAIAQARRLGVLDPTSPSESLIR